MLRGEFIRGDGLVIPNNITTFGLQFLLGLIFNSSSSGALWIGLGSAVYDPALTAPFVNEPAIANGYARVSMARDTSHWTIPGAVNGEWYAESVPVVFSATGNGFNKPISRMFLSDGQTSANLVALSGALPAPIHILSTTPAPQTTFKYRLYLR